MSAAETDAAASTTLAASGPEAPARAALLVEPQPHKRTYHGAHRMFERVNAAFGADWTLHDLRHSAAVRVVRDPAPTLTDVQWALGHRI